jgi:hypothetical protein
MRSDGDLIRLEWRYEWQRFLLYDLRLLFESNESTVVRFLGEIEALFLLCIHELADTAV